MEIEGQQWRAIEDCSTDERLQLSVADSGHADEYVEHPET